MANFEPVTRIEKLLSEIEENTRSGGGSSLPAVTSDDNGNVLTVVEGEWAKAAPSGGGSDIFVVHFEVTWDEGTQSAVVTCDKTAAEIAAAGDAGKLIIGKALMMQTEPERTSFDVVAYTYDGNPYVTFEYITIWPSSEIGRPSSDDWLEHSAISWGGTDWEFQYSDYQLTPKA